MSEYAIEVLDQFVGPNKNDRYWLSAVKLAEDLGYAVLSLAAVSKYNGAPLWARTTMSEEWAALYVERNYFRCDPLIAHMQASNEMIVLETEAPIPTGLDPLSRDFMETVQSLGYGRFRGHPFNWPTLPAYKIVTFGLMAGEGARETEEMVRNSRVLANVLATRIGPPMEKTRFGAVWPPKPVLTDRERELLYYLALGLKNDRIAERCGLAEVTVRKHLLSARAKLGAATREQALAIALQDGLINF